MRPLLAGATRFTSISTRGGGMEMCLGTGLVLQTVRIGVLNRASSQSEKSESELAALPPGGTALRSHDSHVTEQ